MKSVSYHHFGWAFPNSAKSWVDEVVQLRSKRVFSTIPIGAMRINTHGIEFHEVAFIPPFWWAFPSSAKSRVDEGHPIAVKTRFFEFPNRGEANKKPMGSNSTRSVSYHYFGWAFANSGKFRVDEGRPIAFKTRLWTFPIGAKGMNTLGIEFHDVGFLPPFWVGFSKQCKKPGWGRSPNCGQNAFFRLSPSGRSDWTPWGDAELVNCKYLKEC